MNRFATEAQAKQDPTPLGLGDYYYVIPENFTQGSGVFPFKAGTNPPRTFAQLPYAPNRGYAVVTSTSSGSVSGPGSSTVGNLAIWDNTTGTLLADGPAPSDFATAAQGALADTALQPGDPLTDLSSGAALNNYIPVSDGAGGISWAPQSGGGMGDVTGPASSVDNSVSRFDGTTGKLIQGSTVTISDAGALNGIALLNGSSLPLTPGTLITTAAITNMLEVGDPLTDLSSGAATAGQVPEADGAGNISWVTPTGGGDVVGPVSSVDGNVPQFDGTTGKLLKDGLGTSTGGNAALDAGKVVLFGAEGQVRGSADSSGAAIYGSTTGNAYAGYFANASAVWPAVYINGSGSEPSLLIEKSGGGVAVDAQSTETAAHFHASVLGAGTPDIATFVTGLAATPKLNIKFDGGLEWGSTGAQTTATNLPAFASGTKGVVPASGGGTTNFLRADGTWTAPPDTGITQLTGDVTAGPGSGSQAATLASTAVTPGSYTYTSLTVDAKGRLTAASNGTTPLLPSDIGVTVQAYDADLQAIAGLTSAASKGIQFTGAGTATTYNLDFGTEAAYGGTLTWTASAAPSGSSNLRQFYSRSGNVVVWQISLTYASAGTAVTNLVLTFPTEFPTPAIPTGFTGANVRLYGCDPGRLLTSLTGAPTIANGFMIGRNSGDTGFVISTGGATFTSGNYNTFLLSGQYFTATA